MNDHRVMRLPISIVLGAALMTLASALTSFEVAEESLPHSCVSFGGVFAGVAVLALVAGIYISIREVIRIAIHQPPNPRLQRTPLRAPLSRKPLGD